jgi:hypothetical protein
MSLSFLSPRPPAKIGVQKSLVQDLQAQVIGAKIGFTRF